MIHPLFSYSDLVTVAEFERFQQKINQLAQAMSVDLTKYQIDHLAIRVNSEDNARKWLALFMKLGTILSDNIVNDRIIYLIQLNEPLIFLGQPVDIVELPFPKNKCYPLESWEHIEIVIPFNEDENVSQWLYRLEKRFLWNQLTTLNVKVSVPKVDGEKLPNPSIAVSFADKSENFVCIKVHPYNIKTIIEV
ncbi:MULTISPECIES: VOC family protein [unclassified Lonepinella]|uniref:VOC family protein n=1 Tax=unclassified Lonepinella TaxID=2642006 RepID=UPI0036DAA5C8